MTTSQRPMLMTARAQAAYRGLGHCMCEHCNPVGRSRINRARWRRITKKRDRRGWRQEIELP